MGAKGGQAESQKGPGGGVTLGHVSSWDVVCGGWQARTVGAGDEVYPSQ